MVTLLCTVDTALCHKTQICCSCCSGQYAAKEENWICRKQLEENKEADPENNPKTVKQSKHPNINMVKLGKKKVVEELSRKKIKNGADTDEEVKKQTEKNKPGERANRRSSNADTGSSGSISIASSARKKNAQKRKAKSTDRSGSEDSDDLPLEGRRSIAVNAKDDDSRAATPAKKQKQAKTKAPEKTSSTSPNKNGKKSSKPAEDVEEDVADDDSDAESGGEEYEVSTLEKHKMS